MLLEGRDLPVWGFPWTSNPWCRVTLGTQAEASRRDDDTSRAGRHGAPVWRQEFQFLVRATTHAAINNVEIRYVRVQAMVSAPFHVCCPRVQVEDPAGQSLEVQVRDSHLTGRSLLGRVRVPLTRLPSDSTLDAWLPVEGPDGGRAGEIHLQITYKASTCPRYGMRGIVGSSCTG